MEFEISREQILKPLQMVVGVVERRQTLPILANVLIKIDGGVMSITATDLEIEMTSDVSITGTHDAGEITLPARKFIDICKALPDSALLKIKVEDERAVIRSGKSRFVLSTLPAAEFPNIDKLEFSVQFNTTQNKLKQLIDKTQFAMAQQDVRYYLNGLMLEFEEQLIRAVATDGHRLALCDVPADTGCEDRSQIIVPRKAVAELSRLLEANDNDVEFDLGINHIRLKTAEMTFISKLIDGKFPDYQRVVPENSSKKVIADREGLKQTLGRASILSNEKYRSVRFAISDNLLKVSAHNPEQEEAEEEITIEYNGSPVEIGFNASYIMDALSALNSDNVVIETSDENSCCLIKEPDSDACKYVVMPMRL